MKKIAITLANGQLGSRVINKLIDKVGKENIVGLARTPSKAEHLGIEIRKGDYNIKEDFNQGLKSIDTLLLISGTDEPLKRVEQHRNVISAAKQNHIRKIVFTSIIGDENDTTFNAIIKSNRQTESDIIQSGINWSIGRNSLYVEPDLEYLETYKKLTIVRNSAADGKCGYTSRDELAEAYVEMLIDDKHNKKTYNLLGKPISQKYLVHCMNQMFKTDLVYKPVSTQEYLNDRKLELGDFLGTVISSIYENIRNGAFDLPSDFETVTGRPHKSLLEMMKVFNEVALNKSN